MNTIMRDERPDVDRVLAAVQLRADGYPQAARRLLGSLGVRVSIDLDEQMDTLALRARERDETLADARLVTDDPRLYRDLHEDEPVYGSLLDYSDERAAQLEVEAEKIAAEIRTGAELIASHAWKAAAA